MKRTERVTVKVYGSQEAERLVWEPLVRRGPDPGGVRGEPEPEPAADPCRWSGRRSPRWRRREVAMPGWLWSERAHSWVLRVLREPSSFGQNAGSPQSFTWVHWTGGAEMSTSGPETVPLRLLAMFSGWATDHLDEYIAAWSIRCPECGIVSTGCA